MNLNKIYEFFKGQDQVNETIHIIGCGAVGSVVAEVLARFGFTKVVLYDFDVVEDKNIANQMFGFKQIGMNKAEATKQIMMEINPACTEVKCETEGWTDQDTEGIIIMCPDKIAVRKEFFSKNNFNMNIKYLLDFRMGLTNGDFYLIKWLEGDIKKNYSKTMNFNDEDIVEVRSACHEVLSFCPAIRAIVAIGIANLIKQLKGQTENLVWYGCFDPYNFEMNSLRYRSKQ